MRWIDIILPQPKTNQAFDALLDEARVLQTQMTPIQENQGLDSPALLGIMAEVGGLLRKAIARHDPEAFSPQKDFQGLAVPLLGNAEHDDLIGYHLVADPQWLDLPWTWLHNGLEFVLEKHPLCVADHPSDLPPLQDHRPWMTRLQRAGFLVGPQGGSELTQTLDQLRPWDLATPEVLFVAGHTDQQIRRMIAREAEAIQSALAGGDLGECLARLDLPQESMTPAELIWGGIHYQAIHFGGHTSQPGVETDSKDQHWMNHLLEQTLASEDAQWESAMGVETEVLGVDPITSLLDSVSEHYDREGLRENQAGGGSRSIHGGNPGAQVAPPWLLDDGPVEPENLGQSGGMPPLVFSNSFRALPELGARFARAGASTFVGPLMPLFSRPARLFTGYYYGNLADGWSCGPALWKASRQIREELGRDHPAWLSYGMMGYGSLALQYL